ncbi:MAG: SDR family oxidoreductase, partial [Verrucomicrobiota bacterium]|nr:SDR family oxidoreductase [Verrucomicrobiota bacterium]
MHKVKNHLIGGITGGIGSELAVKLSAEGDSVSGYARKAAVTDSFSPQGEFKLKTCDATDPEALETVINEFQNELGSIDSYTHAIGSIYLRPAHLTPIEDWLQTIETNLSSAFYALRIVTKVM